MILLSLSAVVGCGARRGLADFLPEGKRSQKDPRVVGLLHLRHSGQHWFSLRLAESGLRKTRNETNKKFTLI